MCPHEFQIFQGCAPSAIARRGFHPICPQLAADFAKPDLVLVFQVAVLKDHLDFLAVVVGEVNGRLEVLSHVSPVAAENLAYVDDHIQLLATVLECPFGFCKFDCRGMPTMGKAYSGTGLDGAAAQNIRAPL